MKRPKPRKDIRIDRVNARYNLAVAEAADAKKERMKLMATMYGEGWTVPEIVVSFKTTLFVVKAAIGKEEYEKNIPLNDPEQDNSWFR